ncbi:hypothetical protein ACFL3S_06120 [Gemmatimonadota bacterium]
MGATFWGANLYKGTANWAKHVGQTTVRVLRHVKSAATGRSALQLVLQRGMTLVLVGLGVGVVGAMAATRLMGDLLFPTDTKDLGTIASVGAFFVLTAFLACLLPAWRAVRADPVEAFRAE